MDQKERGLRWQSDRGVTVQYIAYTKVLSRSFEGMADMGVSQHNTTQHQTFRDRTRPTAPSLLLSLLRKHRFAATTSTDTTQRLIVANRNRSTTDAQKDALSPQVQGHTATTHHDKQTIPGKTERIRVETVRERIATTHHDK